MNRGWQARGVGAPPRTYRVRVAKGSAEMHAICPTTSCVHAACASLRNVALLPRFLQLMPAQMHVSRIISALIVALMYMALLLVLKPFLAFPINVLAILTQLFIVLMLIAFGVCMASG
jgi:hypothetical protein